MTRPAHAFPTTYPPPLRPPPRLSPVEWPHTPETSPTPSACAIDIDSLCDRFVASLVIDENPRQPRQSKPSLFSLPASAREELSIGRSRSKPPKRKHSLRANEPPALSALDVSPSKIVKPRRHSVPPFPSPPMRAKATPRRTSAPPRVSMRGQAPEPSQPFGLTHTSLTRVSLLNSPVAGGSDRYSCSLPSTLLEQPPPFDTTLDRTTHLLQGSSHSPTGPTTPPTLLPDIFSEPIVVPSTPIHLSPRSSLMPIADPFLQFESQSDYFSDSSLGFTFNYDTLTPGLASGGCLSTTAFGAPLGFDHLFHGNPTPTTPDSLESPLLYTVL